MSMIFFLQKIFISSLQGLLNKEMLEKYVEKERIVLKAMADYCSR